MDSPGKHLLVGCAAVLAFDTLASLTSLVTGVPYAWFTIGSVVIYFLFSYLAAPAFGLGKAVFATVLLAMIDGSLGLGISWAIGPGRQSMEGMEDIPPLALALSGAVGMAMWGTAFGLIGGGVARMRTKGRSRHRA